MPAKVPKGSLWDGRLFGEQRRFMDSRWSSPRLSEAGMTNQDPTERGVVVRSGPRRRSHASCEAQAGIFNEFMLAPFIILFPPL